MCIVKRLDHTYFYQQLLCRTALLQCPLLRVIFHQVVGGAMRTQVIKYFL